MKRIHKRTLAFGVCVAILLLSATPAFSFTTFNMTYDSSLSGHTDIQNAYTTAANNWGAILGDSITVKLTVEYKSLGTGILSQTNPNMLLGLYDPFRDMVSTNAGETNGIAEAALLPNLPNSSQFSANLPSGFGLGGYMGMSSANYHALGGTFGLTSSDGTIVLSSNALWDTDPSDGITAGYYDLQGMAMHQIAHALGFTSEVNRIDQLLSVNQTAGDIAPTTLDLFRFSTADLSNPLFNFTTATRELTPGGSHSFYMDTTSVLMATGALNGDGDTASHWKDGLGLGLMAPSPSTGVALALSNNDLVALDLIGWDIDVEPASTYIPEPTTLLLFGAGLAGIALRRRRKK